MIAKIKNHMVKAPKELIAEFKNTENVSFNKDIKNTEYWMNNGMYKVTYNKHNKIHFKKVLSY